MGPAKSNGPTPGIRKNAEPNSKPQKPPQNAPNFPQYFIMVQRCEAALFDRFECTNPGSVRVEIAETFVWLCTEHTTTIGKDLSDRAKEAKALEERAKAPAARAKAFKENGG